MPVLRRWFTLGIAMFEAFFLNVIVPGHQRGIVQLPGAQLAPVIQVCPFCCAGDSSSRSHSKDSKDNSPANRPGTCAICAFAAHLSVPPVFDFSLTTLMLLGPVENNRAHSPAARIVLLPFDERGPPLAA